MLSGSLARGALTIVALLAPRNMLCTTPSISHFAAAEETVPGIEYIWVGGRGYWGDASNWNPQGVPGVNDTAVIAGFSGQGAEMHAEYNTSVWLGTPAQPTTTDANTTTGNAYANQTNYANVITNYK